MSNYLLDIKGLHSGKCGFVIGNGPSLRISDLDSLKGQITIASNKVYLAYSQTAWRPSYYTVVDDLFWSRIAHDLHLYVPDVIVQSYIKVPPGIQVRVHKLRILGNAADTAAGAAIPFSADLTKGAFGGYSVTYENLQLAVHLGLNPIYLVGCDHFYSGSEGVEGRKPVASDGANHFVPNYAAKGEVLNPALISKMTKSFQCAQRYAEASGVRILNATRGGYLEVFPRVDLDTVLSELGNR